MLSLLGSQSSGGKFLGKVWDRALGTSANVKGLPYDAHSDAYGLTPSITNGSGFLTIVDALATNYYFSSGNMYAGLDLSTLSIMGGSVVSFEVLVQHSNGTANPVNIYYTDGTYTQLNYSPNGSDINFNGIYTLLNGGVTVPQGKILRSISGATYVSVSDRDDGGTGVDYLDWSTRVGTITVIS
jgi:hypothetical protein